MEELLKELIGWIANGEAVDESRLTTLLRRHNRGKSDAATRIPKRRLRPAFLQLKRTRPELLQEWGVTEDVEREFLRITQLKPRRTASGVATVTVITKPHPCSSDCIYCPSDIRMPKSYIASEPACQRAEQNFFDPYLQVCSRLRTLAAMGHPTDKIELIVLGGTWNDYDEAYRLWFVSELYRALNDFAAVSETDGGFPSRGGASAGDDADDNATDEAATDVPAADGDAASDEPAADEAAAASAVEPDTTPEQPDTPARPGAPAYALAMGTDVQGRIAFYRSIGLLDQADAIQRLVERVQQAIDAGESSYNRAVGEVYGTGGWTAAARVQQASWDELLAQHKLNESAHCRAVGLSIETRPDLITPQSAREMRRMGCTKIQMGIQSLDQAILDANERRISIVQIAQAFSVLRLHGFKIQVHFMANLVGATPAADKQDYAMLVGDERFLPDEVKIYPLALTQSSRLTQLYENGSWAPYSREDLMDVLAHDVSITPAYVRISRMIRDIPADVILAGNKATNLRQMVDEERERKGISTSEIRQREVATADVSAQDLHLDCVTYDTTVAQERFLQWVGPDNEIAGFLRLSLPHADAAASAADAMPRPGEAMIREVHVYGRTTQLGEVESGGAQHIGLGRQLVQEAARQAREAGYTRLNVISSVGTREYYRSLGFTDDELYQYLQLMPSLQ